MPPPVPQPAQAVPIYQPKTVKVGGPGSYSKKVFAFSFLSLVLACIGFGLEFLSFIRFTAPIYVFPRLPGGPVLLIAALILHFIGVIFAIVSRVNSRKAREHEIENSLEKVGRVFGILGIIANIIPLVVVNLVLVFYVIPHSAYPMPPIPD
jgi:hypothetical protein